MRNLPGWVKLTDGVPLPTLFQAVYAWDGVPIKSYGLCAYGYIGDFPCLVTDNGIISWHDITHWRYE